MDLGAEHYRRYLDGEDSAFDYIIKEYFDSLVFFLNRYVHDPAAAEDLAVDAFSDLIVHRHRFNFQVSLKTYLFMIGRSRALNYIRRRGRMTLTELSEAEQLPSGEPSLEELLLADTRRRTIADALSRLDGQMQIVVHLVYFEQLSCEEAAKIMKRNRKQVYNLLYRAKNALREILGEEGVQLL